ncbi:conserved hypothetical protein, partial [Coccidioides posadasii str. Silveira]
MITRRTWIRANWARSNTGSHTTNARWSICPRSSAGVGRLEMRTPAAITTTTTTTMNDDPGTSWFTEHNAPEKVLRFLTAEGFPLAPCNTSGLEQPRILDLGTGNGSMLTLLREEG